MRSGPGLLEYSAGSRSRFALIPSMAGILWLPKANQLRRPQRCHRPSVAVQNLLNLQVNFEIFSSSRATRLSFWMGQSYFGNENWLWTHFGKNTSFSCRQNGVFDNFRPYFRWPNLTSDQGRNSFTLTFSYYAEALYMLRSIWVGGKCYN